MKPKTPKHTHVWLDLPNTHPAYTKICVICDVVGIQVEQAEPERTPDELALLRACRCIRHSVLFDGLTTDAAIEAHAAETCRCEEAVPA